MNPPKQPWLKARRDTLRMARKMARLSDSLAYYGGFNQDAADLSAVLMSTARITAKLAGCIWGEVA